MLCISHLHKMSNTAVTEGGSILYVLSCVYCMFLIRMLCLLKYNIPRALQHLHSELPEVIYLIYFMVSHFAYIVKLNNKVFYLTDKIFTLSVSDSVLYFAAHNNDIVNKKIFTKYALFVFPVRLHVLQTSTRAGAYGQPHIVPFVP